MMSNNLFVDISYKQRNYFGEHICGDSIVYKRIHNENRTIIVLSDGMGHGVKANVLSTLTASMVVNFASAKEDIRKIARIVLNNLPVCSVRKISYSTFTIVNIDHKTHQVTIAEHDNPQSIIFRAGKPFITEWDCLIINDNDSRLQTILTTKFIAQEDDRIVLMSDGITQSGLGSDEYPFGWGHNKVINFIDKALKSEPFITSKKLACTLLSSAMANDNGIPKDDMSSVVIHIHKPKRLLLASCPPSDKELYADYALKVKEFDGKKILCGYPISEIIAQETGAKLTKSRISEDIDVPPTRNLEGIDLVSEGIITINKVFDLLNNKQDISTGKGAAYDICRMLMQSDDIHFILGTKRIARASIYVHDEFELRRNTIRRIAQLLEQYYFKEVSVTYI